MISIHLLVDLIRHDSDGTGGLTWSAPGTLMGRYDEKLTADAIAQKLACCIISMQMPLISKPFCHEALWGKLIVVFTGATCRFNDPLDGPGAASRWMTK